MGLFHRKLCSTCYYPPISPSSPIPIYVDEENQSPTTTKHTKISTYLIISFAIVATAFFLLCCFAIYSKFFSSRRRRQPLSQQQTQDNFPDEEEEEEEGSVVDHPIWYIRTTGLQQSVIGAITVCKYKKGEGLIEGTECSVCLSEFQENENLRLLPKCNHAFHLPCIDTWLRSHTNCPLCRAPIVSDPTRIPSLEPNNAFDLSVENSRMENSIENSVTQLRNNEEEEQGQENEVCEGESSGSGVINVQPRRSVSLDSSEASKINLALQSVLSAESDRYSNRHENLGNSAKVRSSSWTRYLQSAPSSMKRSRSFNGKNLLSWYSRSQKKPNAPLRSF